MDVWYFAIWRKWHEHFRHVRLIVKPRKYHKTLNGLRFVASAAEDNIFLVSPGDRICRFLCSMQQSVASVWSRFQATLMAYFRFGWLYFVYYKLSNFPYISFAIIFTFDVYEKMRARTEKLCHSVVASQFSAASLFINWQGIVLQAKHIHTIFVK